MAHCILGKIDKIHAQEAIVNGIRDNSDERSKTGMKDKSMDLSNLIVEFSMKQWYCYLY